MSKTINNENENNNNELVNSNTNNTELNAILQNNDVSNINIDEALKNVNNINSNDLSTIIELLSDIKKETLEQSKNVKRKFAIVCITCAVSFLLLVGCVVTIVPRVLSLCDQADQVMAKSVTLLDDVEIITDNIEDISNDLAKLELEKTINNMDSLIESSNETISAAMNKIDSLDIDGLNDSISNLSAIVKPLAKLFGRK